MRLAALGYSLLLLHLDSVTPQSGGMKIPRSQHSDGIAALLSKSLANQRAQACPGERAVLACPKHTQIQLVTTFYGRLVPSAELCPPKENRKKKESKTEMSLWEERYEDTSCVVSNANAKVTEKCEHRRKCKVMAKPKTFDQDPCPTTSKYLHIAYKCKPSEFNSEYFCEGSPMQLSCNSKRRLALYSAIYGRTVDSQAVSCHTQTAINYGNSEGSPMQLSCNSKRRLALYSAIYGRTVDSQAVSCHTQTAINYGNSEYSSMQLSCNSKRRLDLYSAIYGRTVDSQAVSCHTQTAINYDCTVDVLPQLMAKCHAQRECSLNVEDSLLGNPCPLGVAKYLTLIFMCVNENVFNEAALKGELGAALPLPPPPTPPEKKVARRRSSQRVSQSLFTPCIGQGK